MKELPIACKEDPLKRQTLFTQRDIPGFVQQAVQLIDNMCSACKLENVSICVCVILHKVWLS